MRFRFRRLVRYPSQSDPTRSGRVSTRQGQRPTLWFLPAAPGFLPGLAAGVVVAREGRLLRARRRGLTLPTLAAAAARAQRSVTASPVVIGGADQILNCNINAAAACPLPTAASRIGVPLTFVDVGLKFGIHNLTITPNGAERIVNWVNPASMVLNQTGQSLTLNPFNDGTNTGWFVT